jgi:hypothetical protein
MEPPLPIKGNGTNLVEDVDDDGDLDANEDNGVENQAANDPADDHDDLLDGDYLVPGSWDLDFSPLDMDQDGLVEMPSWDCSAVPAGRERSKEDAVLHCVSHEVGHALGISYPDDNLGHNCSTPGCLMADIALSNVPFCQTCLKKIHVQNE